MKLKTGNMWDAVGEVDFLLITINGSVYHRKDNTMRLVMGAGIAGQMERRIPNAPMYFGQHIAGYAHQHDTKQGAKLFTFGIARPNINIIRESTGDISLSPLKRVGKKPSTEVLGFQVKHYFNDLANIGLVGLSAGALMAMATQKPHQTFALNFPAIGYGGRRRDEVLYLLEPLPDNVTVWEYDDKQHIVDI